jgi:hypothetical protein
MGLERRGVDLDTRCAVCERFNEDGGHLFFKCKYVKPVWQELNLDTIREVLATKQSAREVLQHVLGLKKEVEMKVFILLWHWWLERNRVWKGERPRPPAVLASMVTRMSDDNLVIGKADHGPAPHCQKHWRRPAWIFFKINSDGSFFPESGEGGWGFVIRDHLGCVIRADAGRCAYLMDAYHSEVIGCREGVRAAVEMGT